MAEMIIRLEVDARTGQRRIIVGYTSDEDALPIEHEDTHRRLVDRLMEAGLDPEGAEIVVERAGGAQDVVEVSPAEAEETREGQTESG